MKHAPAEANLCTDYSMRKGACKQSGTAVRLDKGRDPVAFEGGGASNLEQTRIFLPCHKDSHKLRHKQGAS